MEFSAIPDSATGTIVIACPQRIDVNVSDQLRDMIIDQISQEQYKLILDLSQTKYIDSSGLGAIVARISVLRSNSGDIRLAGVPENIKRLLDLTHLNKIIEQFATVAEAQKSFV